MKYKVIVDMVGFTKGDVVDIDPVVGHRLVELGFFEPAPMVDQKADKQVKRSRVK